MFLGTPASGLACIVLSMGSQSRSRSVDLQPDNKNENENENELDESVANLIRDSLMQEITSTQSSQPC